MIFKHCEDEEFLLFTISKGKRFELVVYYANFLREHPCMHARKRRLGRGRFSFYNVVTQVSIIEY